MVTKMRPFIAALVLALCLGACVPQAMVPLPQQANTFEKGGVTFEAQAPIGDKTDTHVTAKGEWLPAGYQTDYQLNRDTQVLATGSICTRNFNLKDYKTASFQTSYNVHAKSGDRVATAYLRTPIGMTLDSESEGLAIVKGTNLLTYTRDGSGLYRATDGTKTWTGSPPTTLCFSTYAQGDDYGGYAAQRLEMQRVVLKGEKLGSTPLPEPSWESVSVTGWLNAVITWFQNLFTTLFGGAA